MVTTKNIEFKKGMNWLYRKSPESSFLSHPFAWLYDRVVPPVICKLTKCKYHHSGVVDYLTESGTGELYIWEAVADGFKPTQKATEWLNELTKKGYSIQIWESKIKNESDYENLKWDLRLQNIRFSRYDYGSLLLFQLIYTIFGRWLGRTGVRSLTTIYCNEANAYLIGMPKYWQTHCKHLESYLNANFKTVFQS